MLEVLLGTTIDIKFTTRRFSTGAPFSLAGSPAVAAYPGNSTTEITAGITLTTDFDSRTGLNNVRVVATGGNGYASGTIYHLVITAGTVDSVSVVGEVIGAFSLEMQSVAEVGANVLGDINAEVVDALNVDAYAEPGQEAPGATVSLAKKISYLYKAFRNKITQDSTTLKLYADDGTTVDQTATVSDNGTTYTRGELVSGP